MIRILLLLMLVSLQLPLSGQSEIRFETSITDAKIFLKGANLTRTGSVSLPEGKSTVILEKLPTDLMFNSVKLSFGENVLIQNISQNITYLKELDKSSQTLTLNKKRDSLDMIIKYEQLDLDLFNDKITLIKKNSELDKNGQNVLQEVKNYLALYDNELRGLNRQVLDLTIGMDSLKSERSKIEKELRALNIKKEEATLELTVEVATATALTSDVKLEYYTPNAAWFPKYSARVQSTQGSLDLEFKALIVQSTPEPWVDVNVVLSNVQPDFEGTLPKLEKWELTYKRLTNTRSIFGISPVNQVSGIIRDQSGEPLIGATVMIQGTTLGAITDLAGYYKLSVPDGNMNLEVSYVGYESQVVHINRSVINIVLGESEALLDEVAVMGSSNKLQSRVSGLEKKKLAKPKLATVEEKLNAVEYTIIEKQTIENSGTSRLIDVQEYKLDAKFEHHTIPKLKPDVYIQALISNWDDYYFLNGEMNIYFENSYVGKSLLETNVFSDTLFLSLGKDYNVSVERKPIKTSARKQFLGSNKVVTKAFEINVKNQKAEAINLFVHDQIPVSIINTIDVELLEKGTATLNIENGELLWQEQIAPKGSKSINFSYKVKFPKGEEVVLE